MSSKTTIALKGLFGLKKAQENQKISVKAKLLSYRAVYCFRESIKYSLADFFRQGRPPITSARGTVIAAEVAVKNIISAPPYSTYD